MVEGKYQSWDMCGAWVAMYVVPRSAQTFKCHSQVSLWGSGAGVYSSNDPGYVWTKNILVTGNPGPGHHHRGKLCQ